MAIVGRLEPMLEQVITDQAAFATRLTKIQGTAAIDDLRAELVSQKNSNRKLFEYL